MHTEKAKEENLTVHTTPPRKETPKKKKTRRGKKKKTTQRKRDKIELSKYEQHLLLENTACIDSAKILQRIAAEACKRFNLPNDEDIIQTLIMHMLQRIKTYPARKKNHPSTCLVMHMLLPAVHNTRRAHTEDALIRVPTTSKTRGHQAPTVTELTPEIEPTSAGEMSGEKLTQTIDEMFSDEMNLTYPEKKWLAYALGYIHREPFSKSYMRQLKRNTHAKLKTYKAKHL